MSYLDGMSRDEVSAKVAVALKLAVRRCRSAARERLKNGGEGLYTCQVYCGEKQVADCQFMKLSRARARVRRALVKHGDEVTAWQISDETGEFSVRVAGAVEVRS